MTQANEQNFLREGQEDITKLLIIFFEANYHAQSGIP